MSIEGQGHFFTIYFPGFLCFVLYWAKISGERLHDHWSSGFGSVSVAEWPPFGKELLTRLAICYLCILTICNISYFPFWF